MNIPHPTTAMNIITKTTALCIALLLGATSVQARADGAIIRTLTHNNPEHRGASARVFDDKVQLKWRKEQVRDWYVYHAPGYITDPKKMCFDRPNQQVVNRRQNQHTISGLSKGSIYTFMVVAHYLNKTAPPQNSHCDYVYHAFAVAGKANSAGTIRNINPGNKDTKFHLGLDAVKIHWNRPKGDVIGYKMIYAEKSWKAWQMCTFDFPSVNVGADGRYRTVAGLKRKQHYTFMVTAKFRDRPQDCAYLFFASGNTHNVAVQTTWHRNPKQVNVETKIFDDKVTLKWYKDKVHKWHIYLTPGFVGDARRICTERRNAIIIDGNRHEYTITGLKRNQPYTVLIETEHGGDRLPPQIGSHCEYVYHRSFVAGKPDSDLRVTNLNPGNQNASAQPGDGSVRFTWRKPSDSRGLTGYRILYAPYTLLPMHVCAQVGAKSFRLGTTEAREHTLRGLQNGRAYTFLIVAEFHNRSRDCDYIYRGIHTPKKVKVTSSKHYNPDHHEVHAEMRRNGTMTLKWRQEGNWVRRWYVYYKPGYVADAKAMCSERPNAQYVASNRNSHTFKGLKKDHVYTFLVESEHKDAELQSGLRTHCDYVYHGFAVGGRDGSAGGIRNRIPSGKGSVVEVGDRAARLQWRRPADEHKIYPWLEPNDDWRAYRVFYQAGTWEPWEMCVHRYRVWGDNGSVKLHVDRREHTLDNLKDGQKYTFLVQVLHEDGGQGCDYIVYGKGTTHKKRVTSTLHKNPDHNGARVEPSAQGDVARVVWQHQQKDVRRWHLYHTEGYVADAKKMCSERPNPEITDRDKGGDQSILHLKKGQRYTVMVEAEYSTPPQLRTHCDYVFHQHFIAGEPNSSFRMRNLNPNTDNVTLQTGDHSARLLWKRPRKDAIGFRFRVREGRHNAFGMCTEKPDLEKRVGADKNAQNFDHTLRDPLIRNDKTYTVMIVAELHGHERDCNYVYTGIFSPHRLIVRSTTHKNPKNQNNSVYTKDTLVRLRWRNDKNVRRWHVYHTEGAVTDVKKLCTERPNAVSLPGNEFSYSFPRLHKDKRYTFLVEMESRGPNPPVEMSTHCDYIYFVHVRVDQGVIKIASYQPDAKPKLATVRTATHLNPSHRNSYAKPGKGKVDLRWDNPVGEVDWKWHIYYKPGTHTDVKKFCTERPNEIVVGGYTDKRTVDKLLGGQVYTFMVESYKNTSRDKRKPTPKPPYNSHCNYILHMQATPK